MFWLYEHAPRWWRIDTALRTLGMALWPPGFWRRIQPHISLRPHRLALWPAMLVAIACLACAALAAGAWLTMKLHASPVGRAAPPFVIVVWLFNLIEDEYLWSGFGRLRPFIPLSVQIIAFNAAALGACMLAPSHWRGRIRPAHMFRVAAMGVTPAIALFGFAAILWSWRIVAMPFRPGRTLARGATPFLPYQEFPYAAPEWLEHWAFNRSNPADEIFALVWLLLWWWCALRIGLHVRQSFLLWLGVMIIALCVAMLLGLQNGLLLAVLWGL